MIFEKYDTIVFAGDSVTDAGSTAFSGKSTSEHGDALGNGYVRAIENMLMAFYPDLNVRVINSGVNGDTSKMLLDRWQADVLDYNPDWVSICIGINDVWRQFDYPNVRSLWVSPEDYEANMRKMLDSLKGKVKGFFIMTPFYMERLREDTMRARMDVYSDICRKLAEEYACPLVDNQTIFDEYFKIQHSTYIAWDRVHPSQIGAMLMAREFLSKTGFDFNRKI